MYVYKASSKQSYLLLFADVESAVILLKQFLCACRKIFAGSRVLLISLRTTVPSFKCKKGARSSQFPNAMLLQYEEHFSKKPNSNIPILYYVHVHLRFINVFTYYYYYTVSNICG